MVNDFGRRRVVLLDARLATVATIVDSATMEAPGLAGALPSARVAALAADSSAYLDAASGALLVIAPDGRVARRVAVPRADLFNLAGRTFLGTPTGDPRGRVVYLGNRPRTPDPRRPRADSLPLIRADFTRQVFDTLEWLRADPAFRTRAPAPGSGGVAPRRTLNLGAVSDAWGVLTDGTVAVLRAADYRVEWIPPDGARRPTGPLAAGRRGLSAADKQQLVDSVAEAWAGLARRGMAPPPTMEIPVATALPDELPAFRPRDVWSDFDGHIWVRTVGSWRSPGPPVYDVIAGSGAVVERVQLPEGSVLVGFGPGRAVFVISTSVQGAALERRRVR